MPIGEPTASNPIERRLLGLRAADCSRSMSEIFAASNFFGSTVIAVCPVEPCIVVMGVEVDGSIDLRAYATEESRL